MDIIDEDIIAKADEGLLQLIEKAKVAALSKEEYAEYEASLKILSDDGLAEDFGYRRGKEEGLAEGVAKGKAEGRKEGLAEGVAKGKAEGRKEGRAEGIAEGKSELIKRMLAKGYDMDTIADISGLSIDEIMKIKL